MLLYPANPAGYTTQQAASGRSSARRVATVLRITNSAKNAGMLQDEQQRSCVAARLQGQCCQATAGMQAGRCMSVIWLQEKQALQKECQSTGLSQRGSAGLTFPWCTCDHRNAFVCESAGTRGLFCCRHFDWPAAIFGQSFQPSGGILALQCRGGLNNSTNERGKGPKRRSHSLVLHKSSSANGCYREGKPQYGGCQHHIECQVTPVRGRLEVHCLP